MKEKILRGCLILKENPPRRSRAMLICALKSSKWEASSSSRLTNFLVKIKESHINNQEADFLF